MSAVVLVGGATGTTGSRVAERLRQHGIDVRPASRSRRDGFTRFDWYDPESWEDAVRGVDAMYLVAPIGNPDPAPIVRPFLEGAVAAGLRRVVLLSSSGVEPSRDGLGALHQLVVDIVPEWAVLRPSWFMQNFVGDLPAAVGVRAGRLTTATGGGRVGFVDADDIAAVATELLIAEQAPQAEFLLTGPETLSYADVAGLAADFRGLPVEVEHISPADLTQRLSAAGIPAEFAAVLAALDVAISEGAEDRVTDVVERVTGRPPRPLRDVFATHADRLR